MKFGELLEVMPDDEIIRVAIVSPVSPWGRTFTHISYIPDTIKDYNVIRVNQGSTGLSIVSVNGNKVNHCINVVLENEEELKVLGAISRKDKVKNSRGLF